MWTLSRGHCHLETVMSTLSRGHCHVDTVTWTLSLGNCYVDCHVDTVTWTLSRGHCHIDSVIWRLTSVFKMFMYNDDIVFTFSTLIPKANLWIQNNMNIRLVRCETIEKKVCHIDDVGSDEVMFVPKGNHAIYVKGLRYVCACVDIVHCFISSKDNSLVCSETKAPTDARQGKACSVGRCRTMY